MLEELKKNLSDKKEKWKANVWQSANMLFAFIDFRVREVLLMIHRYFKKEEGKYDTALLKKYENMKLANEDGKQRMETAYALVSGDVRDLDTHIVLDQVRLAKE
jgi:hypothetical protein